MDATSRRALLASELADAFFASPWTLDTLAESGASCLGRWPNWIEGLALSVVSVFRAPPGDRRDLLDAIERFLGDHHVDPRRPAPPQSLGLLADRGSAGAGHARPRLAHEWPIAELASVAALAERLELSDGQLLWLADVRSLERLVREERLRNYRYRIAARRAGLPRVLEASEGATQGDPAVGPARDS